MKTSFRVIERYEMYSETFIYLMYVVGSPRGYALYNSVQSYHNKHTGIAIRI